MKRPRPDTRLDWRDPNMLLRRDYLMADGKRIDFIPPDYEQRYRTHLLTSTYQPTWRDDPTYNMRRKK